MANIELVVQQQGMLLKQLATRISKLEKIIADGPVASITPVKDEVPAQPYAPEQKAVEAKKSGPSKICPVCNREVFLIWHKRHVAKCKPEDPCNTGVVLNG